MAHLDLSVGVHIEYEEVEISGIKQCLNAQLDCTFDSGEQMLEAHNLLCELGIEDDNVSLVMYVNQKVFNN